MSFGFQGKIFKYEFKDVVFFIDFCLSVIKLLTILDILINNVLDGENTLLLKGIQKCFSIKLLCWLAGLHMHRSSECNAFQSILPGYYTFSLWVNYARTYGALCAQYNNAFRMLFRFPFFWYASTMIADIRVYDSLDNYTKAMHVAS